MKLIENFQLKNVNSFSVAAIAKQYLELTSVDGIQNAIKNKIINDKFYIIGGGTNTLFTENFAGIVMHFAANNCKISQNKKSIIFIADSGMIWDDFVKLVIKNGAYGIENLAGIPGTVGAAAVQNIGAYGKEQAQFFKYLEAIDIFSGEINFFYKDECKFEYRTSKFKSLANKYFVTKVCYEFEVFTKNTEFNTKYPDLKSKLKEKSELSPAIIYNAVTDLRKTKLPNLAEFPNAGSFFKNPAISREQFLHLQKNFPDIKYFSEEKHIKISAAWLIEKCDWKGKRIKNAGTYKNHSLILINYGGATGAEIMQVANNIITDVFEKFNIKLEAEVVIV